MAYQREKIADFIHDSLSKEKQTLIKQYEQSKNAIGYFFIDNVLPDELALKLHESFPTINETVKKKNIREFKHVAYQMNEYDTLLEEALYAFQDHRIVNLISEICSLKDIHADTHLYAGGLSLMEKNNYLNPHLDNSHDKDRNHWRVLNLLYYTTPNWKLENGGNLELWPNGLKEKQITVESKFNRLVVMATHQKSWHSVSKVEVDDTRYCISNYYFSDTPVLATDTFHVTTFRGRPNEKFKNIFLKADSYVRNGLRTLFKKGIKENPHQYKKKKD
ncbi:2OG-Fe(II) oxygenase [Tenacibaculum sp. M341]|uniref:2OG-Fe(II) oxygenase n=1 Tax=Tenacibaculum sp. M341 TaxID=2530339 RepID=UPI00104E4E41|nr:2OG-Fe(II) oxygenase [Tenacibaculum sp. M341]TCI92318.1 2OG-Fe(II) oxygenase [Tenacibaculum sp. M341]